MFFLISTHFPSLSYSLILPHLASLHPVSLSYSHFPYLASLCSIIYSSVLPPRPPPLLNLSLFNQHPLHINIQAYVLSHSVAPSVFFHRLFTTALTTLTSRGIIFPINHLLCHLHPSVPFLRPPISPHLPTEPPLTPILLNQKLINN